MRLPPGSQLVFQQSLTTIAPVPPSNTPTAFAYSDARFNDWLGKANDLALFAVADRNVGAFDFNVMVMETPDEEVAYFGGPLAIGFTPISASDVTVVRGYDTDALRSGRPPLGLRKLQVFVRADFAGATVRIRVWATGRNGYRRFNRLLFADHLQGTAPLYTPEMCAWFSEADKLSIAAVAEDVSGTSPTLTVQMEESPNGRHWRNVNASPELNVSIFPGLPVINPFGVADTLPLGGFVRYRVQLGGADNGATVRLWVTGRDVRSA